MNEGRPEDDARRAGTAAVLSFVFNGLGQIYNGEIKKGLVIVSGAGFFLVMIILGGILAAHWLLTRFYPVAELIIGLVIFLAGIAGACLLGLYSISDAYRKASHP